jgi:hypothetical protein
MHPSPPPLRPTRQPHLLHSLPSVTSHSLFFYPTPIPGNSKKILDTLLYKTAARIHRAETPPGSGHALVPLECFLGRGMTLLTIGPGCRRGAISVAGLLMGHRRVLCLRHHGPSLWIWGKEEMCRGGRIDGADVASSKM